MTTISMLISALMQGLIYAPMALGVFIAFRILDTPDLTIDGSLVFGMTVCAVVTIAGHPILGLLAGILAGALAGLVTGLLQTKLKINPILAGILTMTGLYTINFAVLGGQSNRYLQSGTETSDTIYKMFSAGVGGNRDANLTALVLTALIVAMVTAILAVFFQNPARYWPSVPPATTRKWCVHPPSMPTLPVCRVSYCPTPLWLFPGLFCASSRNTPI